MKLATISNLKKYYGDRLILDIDTFEIEEYKVDELRFRPKKKGGQKGGGHGKKGGNEGSSDKELKELENLERKEGKSKLDED